MSYHEISRDFAVNNLWTLCCVDICILYHITWVSHLDISGDSIKTFQTLGVNISKTVRYKTITFCICLEINAVNR